jgi:hypothetical protein
MRAALEELARDLFGDKPVDDDRWQTKMSEHLGPGIISQQTLSKLLAKKGTISVGMARDILRRLGEDPNEVLEDESTQVNADMSSARARVLLRNRSFFPADVVDEVRRMSLEVRADWSEIDWLDALMSAYRRHLAKSADLAPKSSARNR